MDELIEATVTCPYCWETLEVLLEPLDEAQSYIEDCQVCCHPILMQVEVGADGRLSVGARRSDD